MNLGIKGKNAIVCAASKGLGKGCAMSLAREGVNLTINARTKDALEAAAKEIRDATGVRVTTVAGDITTEAVRAQLLQACPNPDILVNNAGGPPPGDFREWDRDAWLRALDANMLTPIFLIKATVDGMIARRFGRIVNITSVSVKSPIDILGLSNGARAGLTGFIAGLSRKTVAHNVTINNLLPGPFLTDRKEFLKEIVKPLQDKSETVYVVPGSDAEGFVGRHFPNKKTKQVSNGLAGQGTIRAFLRGLMARSARRR